MRPHLPVGTYGIGVHPMEGYFLRPLEELTTPKKFYGKALQHAERIMTTFDARDSNLGVLLSGEKGSGKTMLMRTLSQVFTKRGWPTILIDEKHHGADFNKPVDPAYPKLAGQHPDYLFAALRAYATEGKAQHGRSNAIMAGQVKQFRRDELKAMANYLSTLPSELHTVPQSKFR